VFFLITNKQPDHENIENDTKTMYLSVLEPEVWPSVIFGLSHFTYK